ncbi:MAG: hypothetical protein JWM56_816 [Candidatus Peribacteria bacterium]|nr:hypothetical protein [Candidatus Peribacteria bacterium]
MNEIAAIEEVNRRVGATRENLARSVASSLREPRTNLEVLRIAVKTLKKKKHLEDLVTHMSMKAQELIPILRDQSSKDMDAAEDIILTIIQEEGSRN